MRYVDILSSLGFDNIKVSNNNEILANCKFCGDIKRNFQLNYQKGLIHCWVCNKGGRFIDLLIDGFGREEQEIVNLYLQPYIKDSDIVEITDEVLDILNSNKGIHYVTDDYDEYWHERGIGQRVIKKYRLGYDAFTTRATIPIIVDNKVMAVIGRATTPDVHPKYLKILPQKQWSKNACLYGFDFVRGYNSIFVVEGPIDVLRCVSIGLNNVVGLLGCYMSYQQQKMLTENFDVVYLMLDNDKAGREAIYGTKKFEGIADRLWEKVKVGIVKYDTQDPGSLKNKRQIKGYKPYIPNNLSV